MSGALAQADVLGIFGREGVDLATRWTCPAMDSPAFKAIQMFRNYDGNNGHFGNTSISCTGGNPDEVSGFASQEGANGAIQVMLINKRPTVAANVKVALAHSAAANGVVYQLAKNQMSKISEATVTSGSLALTLPAESITLVVISPAGQ
jgi:hypothetical protein